MNPRGNDFRWLFANGFGFQMSENEFLLTFGMAQDVSDAENTTVEHTGIVLTPRSAKVLGIALTRAIENWESANGIEIAVPDHKLTEVGERLDKSIRNKKAKEPSDAD